MSSGRVVPGRLLPFRLGGQPPAGPGRVRLRLVPAHVHDRLVAGHRLHPAEAPAQLPAPSRVQNSRALRPGAWRVDFQPVRSPAWCGEFANAATSTGPIACAISHRRATAGPASRLICTDAVPHIMNPCRAGRPGRRTPPSPRTGGCAAPAPVAGSDRHPDRAGSRAHQAAGGDMVHRVGETQPHLRSPISTSGQAERGGAGVSGGRGAGTGPPCWTLGGRGGSSVAKRPASRAGPRVPVPRPSPSASRASEAQVGR